MLHSCKNNICFITFTKCNLTNKHSKENYNIFYSEAKFLSAYLTVTNTGCILKFERRNSPYFAFFTEFDCFDGQLHHSHSGWRM